MSEPISFAARRWEKGDGRPGSHSVREALEVALARIDSGELDAKHIIICVGLSDDEDGGSNCAYFQAGPFNHFAQMGLLDAAGRLMHESATA